MPYAQFRALTVIASAVLLSASPAGHSATAGTDPSGPPVPECVRHFADWRYTTVVNDCDVTVDVTVEYTDGRPVPCRTLPPGSRATFPGHGPGPDHVTGVRVCVPDASEATAARRFAPAGPGA
ncbi:alpha-amylase [Streptomyces glaucus]|uniref:Alpha-amylase n=1 Tax=Streptomyces glaucus TaxID=284029 RepID=A0ABP5XI79_9ACTN